MSRSPRVSIGLPVYNAERFVSTAIESTLAQTFGDFELIISDNASTDGTADVCSAFARLDARIRFVRQPVNCGVNRNHCHVFRMAIGEFFRWAGADDIPTAELLAHAVAQMSEDELLVAYVPDAINIDDSGSFLRRLDRNLDLRESDPVQRADAVLSRHYQMVFAQGLMRRAVLVEIDGRWDYFGWDFILLFELALRGQICNIAGPPLYRRLHADSAALNTRSVAEVRKWVDPTVGSRVLLPHWRWDWERLKSAVRSPLSWRDRGRLLLLLGRLIRWDRNQLAQDLVMATNLVLRRTDRFPF